LIPPAVARLARSAGRFLAQLAPPPCVSCQRGVNAGSPPLCSRCRGSFPLLAEPRCPRCAEPTGGVGSPDGGAYDRSAPTARCGICEDWPGPVVATDAPFEFTGAAAAAVRALKYRRRRALASTMGRAMVSSAGRVANRLASATGRGARPILVPVPLSRARLRERGFNQAHDLARVLEEAGAGELRDILWRGAGAARQAAAGAAQRLENVSGGFWAKAGPARGHETRPVLIVDDVLTTGATINACACALAESGFKCVGAVSFARTLRPLGKRQ